MPEETIPPAQSDTGKEEAKSAEEVVNELKTQNETLSKRLKDQESFIGKQGAEIGELRKSVEAITKPKAEPESDDLISELTEELKKDGLDEDTAKFNAKILAKSGSRILNRELGKKMMAEVIDKIEEATEDGKLDKKILEENSDAIMAEFKARKPGQTVRQNYKIFRDCYDVVTKRKADELSKLNKETDEGKRAAIIANSQQPAGGAPKGEPMPEDAKVLESIKNAGSRRNSVFF